MQLIQHGYSSLRLVVDLNLDRFLFPGMIALGLALGAAIGAEVLPARPAIPLVY